MVAIVKKDKPDTTHCSATLVREKFIITAAHCFKHLLKEAFQVVLGTDNLDNGPVNWQRYQERRDIFKLHIHPGYERKYHNDIAIIELQNEVTYNDGIYPICLPEKSSPFSNGGQSVYVAGYGSTGTTENKKLRSVPLQVLSQKACKDRYDHLDGKVDLFIANTMCASSLVSRNCITNLQLIMNGQDCVVVTGGFGGFVQVD